MSNKILIDKHGDQTRVAIIEDNDLAEIYIEDKDTQKSVGNIYVGKVCRVLPGMQAAFVDIGAEKNAFLYVKDALPDSLYTKNPNSEFKISNVLKVGQELLVQVVKEALGTKGARVTRHITLPGRHLVLLPNSDYIGISRRIEDETVKKNLVSIAQKIKPSNMGLIIRTIANNDPSFDFSTDIEFLTKLWNNILEKSKKGAVPRCVYSDMDITKKILRDYLSPSVDKLIVNDSHLYREILEFVNFISPSSIGKIHFDSTDSISLYNLDHSINKALSKKVWLKCGGYLLIEEAETLTVIDVNTGKFVGKNNFEDTILKTNLEAVKEIARQLRLRDIGGIIIVDFIDMNKPENQASIITAMNEALKKDRTKTTVVGMTQLGLLEMTRKKIRKKLSSVLETSCPLCNGSGRILKGSYN
ncbi:MAG: Rne/Rng family ribonuclease [Clostridiales bacterium]|nr:Rne/Rng family ribonuclease [Clostridiales bacterium]